MAFGREKKRRVKKHCGKGIPTICQTERVGWIDREGGKKKEGCIETGDRIQQQGRGEGRKEGRKEERSVCVCVCVDVGCWVLDGYGWACFFW